MLKRFFHATYSLYHSLISFLAHHRTYTALSFVLLSCIVMYGVFSLPQDESEVYIVSRGNLKQYVEAVGKVKPITNADLSFQSGGMITFIGVKKGDNIPSGKLLATVSAGDSQAKLLSAEATLQKEEDLLAKLTGAQDNQLFASQEERAKSAKRSLEQFYITLPTVIHTVDVSTVDIVKNTIDPLFTFTSSEYKLSFRSCDEHLSSKISGERTMLEDRLADFEKKSSAISSISSKAEVDDAFEAAYQSVVSIDGLITDLSNLLNTQCNASSLASYRASLPSLVSSINTLSSQITKERSVFLAAKNTYEDISNQLLLNKNGADPYKIAAQNALVSKANKNVQNAKNVLDKTLIVSPFTGTIQDIGGVVGTTVAPGKTVISMSVKSGYEVEVEMNTPDLGKVFVGQEAEVTLDAYTGHLIFPGVVTSVTKASTSGGGVFRVAFTGKDSRIKDRAVAHVKIITDDTKNTLLIPARYAMLYSTSTANVIIRKNGKETSRLVSIGARGDDGSLQVLAGLMDGDTLVIPSPSFK